MGHVTSSGRTVIGAWLYAPEHAGLGRREEAPIPANLRMRFQGSKCVPRHASSTPLLSQPALVTLAHSTLEGAGWRANPGSRHTMEAPPQSLLATGSSWFLVFSAASASEGSRGRLPADVPDSLTPVTPSTAVINMHGKHSFSKAQVIQSKYSFREVFLIIMTWCKYKEKNNVNYHSV